MNPLENPKTIEEKEETKVVSSILDLKNSDSEIDNVLE